MPGPKKRSYKKNRVVLLRLCAFVRQETSSKLGSFDCNFEIFGTALKLTLPSTLDSLNIFAYNLEFLPWLYMSFRSLICLNL